MFKNSSYDPGLGSKLKSGNHRILDDKGNFNIVREGQGFSIRDVFQHLVAASWPVFLIYLIVAFAVINSLFALLYVLAGIEGLQGGIPGSFLKEFKQGFFFSVQTCATVGYGHMAPINDTMNYLASIETLFGLMYLSVATGLFYGRFSRPRSAIVYSDPALVTPFKEGTSLQFKIVNRRSDTLMDVQARTILTYLENVNGDITRRYNVIPLELDEIAFMPLTWTLVHYITEDSPIYGVGADELIAQDAELLIQIKAFDETYGQVIYSRHSYPATKWVWNKKFKTSFIDSPEGKTVVYVDEISEVEDLP